jgi:hypothetical protein
MPENPKLFKQQLLVYFTFAIIFCGTIIALVSNRMQKNMKNSRQLIQLTYISYLTTAIGIFILSIVSLSRTFQQNILSGPKGGLSNGSAMVGGGSFVEASKKFVIPLIPSMFTIALLVYVSIIMITNQQRLVDHRVANEYYSYSNAFSILIIIQTMVLCVALYNKINGKSSTNQNMGIMILTIFNAVLLGIMQVILTFFSTDG